MLTVLLAPLVRERSVEFLLAALPRQCVCFAMFGLDTSTFGNMLSLRRQEDFSVLAGGFGSADETPTGPRFVHLSILTS